MKLFAFVAVLGFASAAQLPNSYIPPPSNAGSAGGAGFLQTPNRPINQYLPPGQQSGFRQSSFSGNAFGGPQGGAGFSAQAGHSSQSGGGFGGFGGQQGGGHQGGGGQVAQGGFGGQQGGYSAGGQQGGYSAGGQQYRPSGPSGPQIPIIRYNNVPNSGDGSYQFDYETGNGIMQREEGHLNNAGSEYPEQVVQGEYSYTGDDGQLYKVQYKADGNGFQAVGDHLPTPPPIPEAILKSLAINAAAQSGGYGQTGQYQGGQQGGYSAGGQQGGYSAGGQQGGYSAGGQQGGRPQGGAGGFGGQVQKPFQPARPSFNAQTGYTY